LELILTVMLISSLLFKRMNIRYFWKQFTQAENIQKFIT
jgi:hypothetical protein